MSPLLAGLFLLAPGCEYFPLEPGLTWEYNVTIEGSAIRVRQTMTTLEPVMVGETEATPMQVLLDGKLDGTSYYAVKPSYVVLVAANEPKPLPSPVPVMPTVPKKGAKWEFSGQTLMFGNPVSTVTKSKVTGFTSFDLDGQKHPAMRIESDTEIGTGAGALKIHAIELYSPGIGLVQRQQQSKQKDGGSVTTVLVSFKKGKV